MQDITHVKFKQAAHLSGKDYAKNSVHALTEELGKDHYFKKLVAAGLVVPHMPVRIVTAEEAHKHQSELAEKLLATVDKNLAAKKAASAKAEGEKAGEEGKDAEMSESSEQAEGESEKQADAEMEEAEEKEEHAAPKKSKHRK